jgi:hypothetical protein
MMKKTSILLIVTLFISVLIVSCGGPAQQQTEAEKTDQDVFFERFKELEGKKFGGQEVFIREDMESWADRELVMHVREVHHNVIYLPFRVGDNTSRTWTLYRETDSRLRLRHDHRHDDGTPEDLTLYGGYTGPGSDGLKQVFPADHYTCNMLARICDNEWAMIFSEDMSTFSYILRKTGDLVVRIDFDLTEPL